jgi:hypothetical protein
MVHTHDVTGRHTHGGRPVVVMSLVPGEPLGHPVTPARQQGLVVALRRLFAVPVPRDLRERANGPQWMRDEVSEWLAKDHDLAACLDPDVVANARLRAIEWLATVRLPETLDRVIAQGDGNPGPGRGRPDR